MEYKTQINMENKTENTDTKINENHTTKEPTNHEKHTFENKDNDTHNSDMINSKINDKKDKKADKSSFLNSFKRTVKEFFNDRYNILITIILLFALIIRIKYLFIESLWNDETFYMWYVERFFYEPGYIFAERVVGHSYYFVFGLIALFKIIIGDILIAGRTTILFLSLLSIYIMYLLGKEIKNKDTGIIAAIFLSVHHLYWFIGGKVLLDAPSAAVLTFVFYSLLKADKTKEIKWAILTGLFLALSMNTKLSNAPIFLCIILYYGLVYILEPLINKKGLSELKKLFKEKSTYYLIGSTIIFMLPYIILSLIKFNNIIPSESSVSATAISMGTAGLSRGYLASVTLLNFLLTWYLIPFLIIGIIFCLIYRKKGEYVMLSWLFFYIILTILLGGITTPRYALPAVPAFLLIAAYGLEETIFYLKALTDTKIKWIAIAIGILISIPLFSAGLELNSSKAETYTGYRKAGEWIQRNVKNNDLLFAGSPGYIRLFSGYEFIEGIFRTEGSDNGIIYYGMPIDQNDFLNMLKNSTAKNIYMEVDIWEYANQPAWIYPVTQDKMNFLTSIGFEPVYLIKRKMSTQGGIQEIPVIFILKLNSEVREQLLINEVRSLTREDNSTEGYI